MKAFTFRSAVIIFLFQFLFVSNGFSAQLPVSEKCQISLLTCTPGDELYSVFGHSGIRLNDSVHDIDIVFNYGTFDFNKPNFYVNFLRGILIYSLGVDFFSDFNRMYIYEQRGISEQILNLTHEEKQKVCDFLINNAEPENRDYRYDFLLDNCATRIRDVFQTALGDKLTFELDNWDTTKTFRYLIDEYSYQKRWENFGMNLLIGVPVDKAATPMQQMFLPDYLRDGFRDAYVLNNGKKESFVLSESVILNRPEQSAIPMFQTPEVVLILLFVFVLLLGIYELKSKKHFRFVDFLLLFISGFLGLNFLFLWFFTQHWTTAINMNILWALPTNLYLAFLIFRKRQTAFYKKLVAVSLAVQICFLVFHQLLPQHFQLGMMLMNMILIVRLSVSYLHHRRFDLSATPVAETI